MRDTSGALAPRIDVLIGEMAASVGKAVVRHRQKHPISIPDSIGLLQRVQLWTSPRVANMFANISRNRSIRLPVSRGVRSPVSQSGIVRVW